jgi:hypothetical protein
MDWVKLAALLTVMERVDRFPVMSQALRTAAYDEIVKAHEELVKAQERERKARTPERAEA